MKTSQTGIDLICEFEGFRSKAYKDPVGIWTIGYGFIKGVRPGDTMTELEARERLIRELAEYERGVWKATGGNVNQNQFDALVSFAFNVGVRGMSGSTVIRRHNEGDFQSAARAFGLWNKAGGKVWPGLTRRRAAEAALYLKPVVEVRKALLNPVFQREPDPEPEPLPMPQKVEPERSMSESSMNRTAIVGGGTAAVATVAETARTVADVKDSATSLGDWLVPILLVAVIGLFGFVLWGRLKQRHDGWA